jgi:hypothetical protein
MKDLFSEIIEIKNPSSSVERKKIVELANEQIIHRFDDILNEKYEHLKITNKENNNNNYNEINHKNSNKYDNDDKKILISKIIDAGKLRIDDRIIDEISDILSGLASYSLFIEANRLLQIIASKMIINYQNKVNDFQIDDILSVNTDTKINENLTEIKNINTNTENEIYDNNNHENEKKKKNQTFEINTKKETKKEKNEKWNLSFPCVYGQAYGKQVLLEALLWPRKYSSLYRSLSPTGMRYCIISYYVIEYFV